MTLTLTAYTCRALTPADAPAWQALRLEGARDCPVGFLLTEAETAATAPEQVRAMLAGGTLRGVFSDRRLVGFCGFRPGTLDRTRHRAEIGPFFVTARHQGSGAAATLMEGIVTEALRAGISQLELFVDTRNHRAIRFCERMGFTRIATHPDALRLDGVPRDDHFYVLRLG